MKVVVEEEAAKIESKLQKKDCEGTVVRVGKSASQKVRLAKPQVIANCDEHHSESH